MKRVGIRELRQNLSVHLRDVAAGETLEVTDRGQPVALLGPLPVAPGAGARLAQQGRVARTPQRSLAELPPPAPRRTGEPSLAELLDAERAERL